MTEARLPPSLGAVRWVFVLHVLVLGLASVAIGARPVLAAIAAAVGVSWLGLRRHSAFGFGPRTITAVRHDPARGWQVQLAGQWQEASLLPATRALGGDLLLVFDVSGRRHVRLVRHVDLLPDVMRRLRIAVFEGDRKG